MGTICQASGYKPTNIGSMVSTGGRELKRILGQIILCIAAISPGIANGLAWNYIYQDPDLKDSVTIESLKWLYGKDLNEISSVLDRDFASIESQKELSFDRAVNIWFKVVLDNQLPGQTIVVRHAAALSKSMKIYKKVGSDLREVGAIWPGQRGASRFQPDQGKHTYFIHIKSDILRVHTEFWALENYLSQNRWDDSITGAFCLLSLLGIVSSLIFSFWLREAKFFAYAMVTLTTFVYYLTQSGLIKLLLSKPFLDQYNTAIFVLSICLHLTSHSIYIYELLNESKKGRSSSFLVKSLIFSTGFVVLYSTLMAIDNKIQVLHILILCLVIYGICLPLIYDLGSAEVKIVSVSWVIVLFHFIIYVAYVRGYLPYAWFTSRSVYLGMIAQNIFYVVVILLHFGNLHRLNLFTVRRLQQSEAEKQKELDDRMEAQSLIYVLCHDLANPLSVIKGNVQILNMSADQRTASRLDKMARACNGMESMMSLIRKQEAIRSGQLELKPNFIRVIDSIREAISLFEDKAKNKNIEFVLESMEDVYINADQTAFVYSILANIISNAIKFSAVGEKICFRIFERGTEAVVEIQDFGEGMPESILINLFDQSRVVSRLGTQGEQGTGYGSLQVKKYTELFGGRVVVNSNRGAASGTTVTLFFNKLDNQAA